MEHLNINLFCKVLSDILSEKHGVQIKINAVKKNEEGEQNGV